MSCLTSYYPQTIKSFLEARQALAEILEVIGLFTVIYSSVGLLILWRIKFYRPKPIQPKEPKLERSDFVGGWGFKIFKFVFFTYAILVGLVIVLIVIAVPVSILYELFNGQAGLEYLILFGFLSLFSFLVWLSIR